MEDLVVAAWVIVTVIVLAAVWKATFRQDISL